MTTTGAPAVAGQMRISAGTLRSHMDYADRRGEQGGITGQQSTGCSRHPEQFFQPREPFQMFPDSTLGKPVQEAALRPLSLLPRHQDPTRGQSPCRTPSAQVPLHVPS